MGRDALTKDRALGELTTLGAALAGAPNLLAAQAATQTYQRELSTEIAFYAHSLVQLEATLQD